MKTLFLLIFMLFCAIYAKAQPWIGTVPGNIYYNQGNVGIGTTTPNAPLQVQKNQARTSLTGATKGLLHLIGDSSTPANNEVTAITFENYSAGAQAIIGSQLTNNGTNLFFGTSNGYVSGVTNTALFINPNGNVGIGTITPTLAKLQIVGNIWAGNESPNYTAHSNSKIEVFGTSQTETSIGFWQAGIASSLIGSKPGDMNFYLTNTYDGSSLGTASKSITLNSNGLVGIGTTSPGYKLDVIGTIRAKEIKVDLNGADFVFEKEYKLMPINELEAFVKEQKHLPEVAPAKEMQEKGTDLGNLNSKLLQKVEELTLYLIDQNKQISEQNKQINLLKEENKAIRNLIAK